MKNFRSKTAGPADRRSETLILFLGKERTWTNLFLNQASDSLHERSDLRFSRTGVPNKSVHELVDCSQMHLGTGFR